MTMKCEHCNNEVQPRLVRNIISNGDSQVWLQCPRCDENIKGSANWIKHSAIIGGVDSLPIVNNYTFAGETCEVRGCYKPAEYHHWLPKYIASKSGFNSEEWPMGYLCKEHHVLWHKLIRGDDL